MSGGNTTLVLDPGQMQEQKDGDSHLKKQMFYRNGSQKQHSEVSRVFPWAISAIQAQRVSYCTGVATYKHVLTCFLEALNGCLQL